MGQFHAAFEVTRCHAHKSHPIAVFGVHIGLHFEHKARHLGFFGGNLTWVCFLDLWLGPELSNSVHQFFDAKRVDCRAKPDRGKITLKQGLRV